MDKNGYRPLTTAKALLRSKSNHRGTDDDNRNSGLKTPYISAWRRFKIFTIIAMLPDISAGSIAVKSAMQ